MRIVKSTEADDLLSAKELLERDSGTVAEDRDGDLVIVAYVYGHGPTLLHLINKGREQCHEYSDSAAFGPYRVVDAELRVTR